MSTWITRMDRPPLDTAVGASVLGAPIRVAVKDAIDVADIPTTAGSRVVADKALPADADAECLTGILASGAVIVGKTNLHELCFATTGINPWFGTPVNPLAAERMPGGSSSGSAVAVATGEADIALGTDTGGSIRVPAACCGVVGLKTTWRRVSTLGVWPLSPSLDTVGALAPDVAGTARAMSLLDPAFEAASPAAAVIGRIRRPDVDPTMEAAVDEALRFAGYDVQPIDLPGWDMTYLAFGDILLSEFWGCHATLVNELQLPEAIREGLRYGAAVTPGRLASAFATQNMWQAELEGAFERVELLALPTMVTIPPTLDDAPTFPSTALTAAVNLAGIPAISLPVPSGGALTASLQLVGPWNSEALLCATAARVEAAARSVGPHGTVLG